MGGFDHGAGHDDVSLESNPVRLLQRHIVQERLRLLFAPGARVLDLGPQAGQDALFLRARGVLVQTLEASLGRDHVEARDVGWADGGNTATRVDAEANDLDGAYAPLGVLAGSDLRQIGACVARAVRPGGRVLFCCVGPSPLPALVERALTGEEHPREGNDQPVGVAHAWPAEVRGLLGGRFQWTGLLGLGILVPSPGHGKWTRRHPQAFGVLAALEGIVRAWPGLRALGCHFILEGRVTGGRTP